MITHLHIKNFGIIDEENLDFSNGFTVFTGETGAGKSILVDAINILTGETASDSWVKLGADQSIIEGHFKFKATIVALKDYTNEDEEFVITRIIRKGKSSITRINGQSISLKTLKEALSPVISIIGQHQFTNLMSDAFQLNILDQTITSETKIIKEKFSQEYAQLRQLKKELKILETQQDISPTQIEFMAFQIKDIGKHELEAEEEDALKNAKKALKNITTTYTKKRECSYHIGQAQEALTLAQHSLENLGNIFNVTEILTPLSDTTLAIQDIDYAINQLQLDTDYPDLSADAIEERLSLIFTLKTRYQCQSLPALIDKLDQLKEEYETIKNASAIHDRLKAKYDKQLQACLETSKSWHALREKSALLISKKIETELNDLGFQNAKFRFDLIFVPDKLSSSGASQCCIMVALNPGLGEKPIHKSASGGELSRIMLSIQNVLQSNTGHECIIYDEIDTGVGGEVALKIGEKIKNCCTNKQILCVTHLAQIAQYADHHVKITKESKDNLTKTNSESLNAREVVFELQRMVGGKKLIDSIK